MPHEYCAKGSYYDTIFLMLYRCIHVHVHLQKHCLETLESMPNLLQSRGRGTPWKMRLIILITQGATFQKLLACIQAPLGLCLLASQMLEVHREIFHDKAHHIYA